METTRIAENNAISALSISRDESFFIVSGNGFVSKYCYPVIAKQVSQSLDAFIWSSAISSDNQKIFLCDLNGKGVLVYSTVTLDNISRVIYNGNGVFSSYLLLRPGWLINGLENGQIAILSERLLQEVWRAPRHFDVINAFTSLRDEQSFFSAGSDKRIVHTDIESFGILGSIKCQQPIDSLNHSIDQKYLFAGGREGSLYQFGISDYTLFRTFERIHDNIITSIIPTADGREMITSSFDRKIKFLFGKMELAGVHSGVVNRLDIIAGRHLISVSDDKTIGISPIEVGLSLYPEVADIRRQVEHLKSELSSLLEKETNFLEIRNNFISLLSKYQKNLSSAELFKGTLINSLKNGKCIHSTDPFIFFQSQYNKNTKQGRSKIITRNYILKVNYSDDSVVKESQAELLLVKKGVKLLGYLPETNSDFDKNIRVTEIHKGNYKIETSETIDVDTLSGYGNFIFFNGELKGYFENCKYLFNSENEQEQISFEGVTQEIVCLSSLGFVITNTGSCFSFDFETGFIVPRNISEFSGKSKVLRSMKRSL